MLLSMLWPFQSGQARQRAARVQALYKAATKQARNAVFYTSYHVPDTFTGRFELIILHCGLIIERLAALESDLSQALYDELFHNLELSNREIGIGDEGLPHKMRKMMKAFQGRITAYESDDLKAALVRNLYGTVSPPPETVLAAMADYVLAARAKFESQTLSDLQGAENIFPPIPEIPNDKNCQIA